MNNKPMTTSKVAVFLFVSFRYIFAKGGLLANLFLPEIGTMYEGIWGEKGTDLTDYWKCLQICRNL